MARGTTADISLEDRTQGSEAAAKEAPLHARSTAAERAPHLSATLLSPVDIGVIAAALLAATVVRHHPLMNPLWTAAGLPVLTGSWWSPAQSVLLLVQILAIPFALAALGQYRTSAGRLPNWSFEKVVAVITVTHIVAMAAIYVVRLGYIPRGVMILDYVFLLLGLTGWRINWEHRAMMRLASGEGRRNVLIVGRGPLVDQVTHAILDDPHHGRRIVGYLATHPAEPFETLPDETFERSDVWAPWLNRNAKGTSATASTISQKGANASTISQKTTNGNGAHGAHGNGAGHRHDDAAGRANGARGANGANGHGSALDDAHGTTDGIGQLSLLDVGPATVHASRLTPAIVENVLNQPFHLLATVGTTEHDAVVQTLDGLCVEEVFIAPDIPREEVACVVRACRVRGVDVHIVPPHYQELGVEHEPWKLGEFTMMGLYKRPISQFGWVAKRAMDVVGGLFGLLIFSPLLLLSLIVIKIDAPQGPLVYRGTRIGYKGSHFKILKLSTMVANADDLRDQLKHKNAREGPWYQIDTVDDFRVTKVGRFLRKYSINELPQFWNVVKGEMSLVGPRPLAKDEVSQFVDYDFRYYRAFDVKPGMTGPWQIAARDDPSFDKRIQLDFDYIDHWSVWRDIKILVMTPVMLLLKKGR